MEKIRGRCLCRSVQYELTLPIDSAAHCHCESCRRAHSSAFVSWGRVSTDKFRILRGDGFLAQYESSPGAVRMFCRNCGSPTLMKYDCENSCVYFPLATLDDPSMAAPDRHFSYEERVTWISSQDCLPKYRGKTAFPEMTTSTREPRVSKDLLEH